MAKDEKVAAVAEDGPEVIDDTGGPFLAAPVEVDPLAFDGDPADFSYASLGDTPEQLARIDDILAAFRSSLKSNPLPLQWLTASLERGAQLSPPSGR